MCIAIACLLLRLVSMAFDLTDHEAAIMHRLQGVILENTHLLMDTVDLAAELDW